MSVFHSDLFRQQALIAGSWRDAADGTTLAVSNPSTGATLGHGGCDGGFQVLDRRTKLTPLRKFWLAWKVQALGHMPV